jgi:hypothetical protein
MKLEGLNLVEITAHESVEINAGESGWYWVSYFVGALFQSSPNTRMHDEYGQDW